MAQTTCPAANATVPSGANTTNPSAPFFINLTGLDLSTMPPTRDPANPNYPPATELPDGQLPGIAADGNYIIGPTHTAAPETIVQNGVPNGTVYTFTMSSDQSVIYKPGMIRDDLNGCLDAAIYLAQTYPGDPSNVLVPTSHPGTWTRTITVYVPAQYRTGTEAPFIVAGDGGPAQLNTVLDNLINEGRLPPMIAIGIGAGGQDAQGSERGREYDTVSGDYAEWVETEVLPYIERRLNVSLTKDPDGRLAIGISSSGAAAFTMAWFRPDLYHRVLGYSPTMVNQQWPHNTALPGGAWEYHDTWAGPPVPNLNVNGSTITPSSIPDGSPLIPNSPRKPIRYWFEVGDQDLFYPDAPIADGMHDWTLANENMAKVLAAKGYHYQFIFARNAHHVDGPTESQTLPEALEWVWKGP
ncbi:MAG: alpha/beta hydrolase-fold protein [Pseudomonadota bacterium]|nr:alpha/beta hydrolase-fold protein [Pseudomonadota bacterium]